MGLQTDIIFVKALRADDSLMEQLPAGDVYNTDIALPEKDLDNAPVPFIVVSFDGLTNDQTSKDDYESELDSVNVGVLIAARTRQQLGRIARQTRSQIRHFFMDIEETDEDFDMVPLDYQFTAGAVVYDDKKPCYWQEFNYQCDVRNDVMEDNDED